MRASFRTFLRLATLLLAPALLEFRSARGFPPALPHQVYGTIRDELGVPLEPGNGQVIFETAAGVRILGPIARHGSGINFRIDVPMDTGLTSTPYKPTALLPFARFKIKVQIGSTTFLPIEMTGDFAMLGQPGKETRLNLTLGVDSDGDGLPDAWERALAARSGVALEKIRPDDDLDHDGLSNLEEYLAGTYAYDDKDGFLLAIVRMNGRNPVLAFTAVKRRTYRVYQSADLKNWKPVSFRLAGGSEWLESHPASKTSRLEVEASVTTDPDGPGFFKLIVL